MSPVLIGLIQASIVVIYCALISGFFYFMSHISPDLSVFWGPLLMLLLLVFSATVMGVSVFGYAIVLALDDQLKLAGQILMWTLLFIIVFGACLIAVALLV